MSVKYYYIVSDKQGRILRGFGSSSPKLIYTHIQPGETAHLCPPGWETVHHYHLKVHGGKLVRHKRVRADFDPHPVTGAQLLPEEIEEQLAYEAHLKDEHVLGHGLELKFVITHPNQGTGN